MRRVLLIEDNLELARMYKRLFSYKGYEVIVCNNGQELFLSAQKLIPDLILLDIMMPKMNGLEVLKSLKSNLRTANIKVLLLTNVGKISELDEAVSNGAQGYIIKNDNHPNEVLGRVEALFAQEAAFDKKWHK